MSKHLGGNIGCKDKTSSRNLNGFPDECFYDSPPPNRRLHEPENNEYSLLQAAKSKNKKRDRLVFTITSS